MDVMSTIESKNFSDLRIDLHSHTQFSDGSLTPQELIERAVNFQIDVLAITDHDTVAGLDTADNYVKEKNYDLHLISGIEISTLWQGFEIHIVGLNIDRQNSALLNLIKNQQMAREERAINIGNKLTKCGFEGIYEKAKTLANGGSITRAHFAKVLLHQGDVSKMQMAFDKYLGKSKRAYVKPNWCSIKEAISVVHASGGTAAMAHPVRYDLSTKWLRRLVVQFKEEGGDALEVVLPQMSKDQKQLMLSFCSEYDLHASMGSDFHHPHNKWSDLGRNLRMPETALPIWSLWPKNVQSAMLAR